jgi:acetyl esterase/lipase
VDDRVAERHGSIDLYLPDASGPRPAVVVVHGGPVPAEVRPTPRDWPMFRAYGSAIAARGAVGVTVDHRLHGVADYPLAADDIVSAVDVVRADPRVDGEQIALWFFSGAGLLLADWLRASPDWLRCAAATYPMLSCPPEYGTRFNPAAAVGDSGALPIVLTRVGRESPQIAATVAEFVAAAEHCQARLEIIDVPNGQHSFDILDHTDESREAVERALGAVLTHLK